MRSGLARVAFLFFGCLLITSPLQHVGGSTSVAQTGTPASPIAAVTPGDATPVATPVSGSTPSINLELVANGLVDPVSVRSPNDGTDRLFVVEKVGRVRIIEHGKLLPDPFIDLTFDTISVSSEQGMYDIAFHPDFVHNGLVYVSHTQFYMDGAVVVWEFKVGSNPDRADAQKKRPVIAVQRRVMFHNGGTIAFGPDKFLYLAIGDGRPYPPPFSEKTNWSQSPENLDGKLLRIDVNVPYNVRGTPAAAYAIPNNPYSDANSDGDGDSDRTYAYRGDEEMNRGDDFPEIWAIGLRNPWNFAFDPVTGDLFIPDVGEMKVEEINVQPAGSSGGENYGWDSMEGDRCKIDTCSTFTSPVYAYPHDNTHCSVIGIAVYRGTAIPALSGTYLFSDFCSGAISGLTKDNGEWSVQVVGAFPKTDPVTHISGGGNDAGGNVYITTCTCSGDTRYVSPASESRKTGSVWRVVPSDTSATPESNAAPPVSANASA